MAKRNSTIGKMGINLTTNADLQDKGLNKSVKGWKKWKKNVVGTIGGVSSALAGVFASLSVFNIVQEFSQFESALSSVKAKTGATSGELKTLSALIQEQAKVTKYTATQTAEAADKLAMAGYNIIEVGKGLPAVLALAASTGTAIQNSSDIVSNVQLAMGFAVKDMGKVADVLAKATAKSNADLNSLGEAFSYGAASATGLNLSLEETTAVMGTLADVSIRGSRAGTILRSTLAALAGGSVAIGEEVAVADIALNKQTQTLLDLEVATRNADGGIRSLIDILADLRVSGASYEQLVAIFGTRSANGISQLIANFDKLNTLTNTLENSQGAAAEMSKIMLDNISGDTAILQSQFSALKITLVNNGFGDLVRDTLQVATAFLQVLEPAVASFSHRFGAVTKALGIAGALLISVKAIWIGYNLVVKAALAIKLAYITTLALVNTLQRGYWLSLVGMTTAQKAFNAAALLNPLGLIVAGLLTVTALIKPELFEKPIARIQRAFLTMGISISETLNDLISQVNNFTELLGHSYRKIDTLAMRLSRAKLTMEINGETPAEISSPSDISDGASTAGVDTTSPLPVAKQDIKEATEAINTYREVLRGLGSDIASSFSASYRAFSDLTQGIVDSIDAYALKREQLNKDLQAQKIDQLTFDQAIVKAQELQQKRGIISSIKLSKEFLGEKAKDSKKAAQLYKAVAISEAIYATSLGVTKALSQGGVLGILQAGLIGALGLVQINTIKNTPIGQAHDGWSSLPESGTYNLKKGERVVNDVDNKKLTKALDGDGMFGKTMNVVINAVDARSFAEMAQEYREELHTAISRVAREQMA